MPMKQLEIKFFIEGNKNDYEEWNEYVARDNKGDLICSAQSFNSLFEILDRFEPDYDDDTIWDNNESLEE